MTYQRKETLAAGIDLYLADCRDILPGLPKVDAVLTDPPYGIDHGRNGSFQASHGWGPWRENVEWDRERPPREVFDLMREKSFQQIIWGGNYFTDYLPPTMSWHGQAIGPLLASFSTAEETKRASLPNQRSGKNFSMLTPLKNLLR